MSRSSSSRAQTEPIAALVAVMALTLAIGLYGLYVTDALSTTTDRSIEEPTLEQVWNEIGTGGVFQAYEYTDPDDLDGSVVSTEALPEGQNVLITVTTIDDDGTEDLQAIAQFDSNGDHRSQSASDGAPATAGVDEKPVPVETDPGAVRGGTLRVEVW